MWIAVQDQKILQLHFAPVRRGRMVLSADPFAGTNQQHGYAGHLRRKWKKYDCVANRITESN